MGKSRHGGGIAARPAPAGRGNATRVGVGVALVGVGVAAVFSAVSDTLDEPSARSSLPSSVRADDTFRTPDEALVATIDPATGTILTLDKTHAPGDPRVVRIDPATGAVLTADTEPAINRR